MKAKSFLIGKEKSIKEGEKKGKIEGKIEGEKKGEKKERSNLFSWGYLFLET